MIIKTAFVNDKLYYKSPLANYFIYSNGTLMTFDGLNIELEKGDLIIADTESRLKIVVKKGGLSNKKDI